MTDTSGDATGRDITDQLPCDQVAESARRGGTGGAIAVKRRLSDVTTGLYFITAICGLVDAVCFLALGHVFAEMMTGNLLLLAFTVGTGHLLEGSARYVPAILGFVVGALVGAVCCAARASCRSGASALPSNGGSSSQPPCLPP